MTQTQKLVQTDEKLWSGIGNDCRETYGMDISKESI